MFTHASMAYKAVNRGPYDAGGLRASEEMDERPTHLIDIICCTGMKAIREGIKR